MGDLPGIGRIVTSITEVAENEHASATDLALVIERDPAVTARLLRLANSPYFGFAQTIDSAARAVALLGFDAVRNLVLATTVIEVFANRKQAVFNPEDFWVHSFGTAKAAKLLCARHCRVQSPSGCQTIALLHDIGRYVLALILAARYQRIITTAQNLKHPLHIVEFEKLGTDHAAVGAWLLTSWQFPPAFAETVGNHCKWREYSGIHAAELHLVCLANDLAYQAGFVGADKELDHPLDEDLLQGCGFTGSPEAVADILADLEPARLEAQDFLKVLDAVAQ